MEELACGKIERAREIVFFILACVMTVSWLPRGIHAAPILGKRWISSSSAKTNSSCACKCSICHRIRAKRSTRCGWLSLATKLPFHTEPVHGATAAPSRRRPEGDVWRGVRVPRWHNPAGATPTKGLRRGLEESDERALDPGHQDGGADGGINGPSPPTVKPSCSA